MLFRSLQLQINKSKSVIEELESELQNIKPQLDRLLPENEHLKCIIENSNQGISQLVEENNGLKQAIEFTKRQFEADMENISRENMGMNNEIGKLRRENDQLNVIISIIIG